MHSNTYFSSRSFFSFRFVIALLLVIPQVVVLNTKVKAAPEPEPVVTAPLRNGAAAVSISGLGNVPVGQNVSFSVSFDNTGTTAGYGPFIDVILDTTGTDGIYPGTPAPANTYDGLGTTTISAKYLGAAIPAQDFFTVQFDAAGNATHPFALNNLGQKIVVTGTPGDTLVVVRLPFGSFSPTQPPAAVDFTVNMSNLADVNGSLSVQARGGFEFGNITPLNDWCCGDDAAGTLTPWSNGTVIPTLFTLSKTFSGPESETATGPNYPRTYTVTATIAAGQTINNLQLTDTLPNNVQFVSMVTPAAASCTTLPSTTVPGGTLRCNFAAATGTVNMTFNFYVPRVDSIAAVVLNASTGDDGTSCNNASITGGTWAALDTRDVGGLNFTTTPYNPAGCENTFTPKSIAIQKAVTVIGGGNVVPGKVLEYTLTVQVSDFFAFNNVIATDVISDGQHFDATFTPTIQVNGNGYTIATRNIPVANYTVDTSKIDVSDGPPPAPENAATDGTTTLTFRVSDEIDRTQPNGRMVGGCVDPVNGSPTPDCSVYNNAGTTATIVFRTVVQESFTDNYPTGDWSVDQGDVLDDVVNVTGDVLNTATPFTPTGNSEPDSSNASVSIARGALTKSIYAINGNTTLPTNALGQIIIKPSDTVTYRLTYVSATSDVENLYFEDFLPLPIFHADDPDDNGTVGPAWTFDPTVSAASPASGVVKFGPSDTFYAYTAGAGTTGILSSNTLHAAPATREPKISIDAGNNKLIVAYATYDDTRDISRTIDLLFTVTVSDEPFADNLYLTNQAMVYEGSTFNSPSSATSIVQVVLTEPVLVHKKGVIATNSTNPNISFSPTTVGPVVFNAPGTAGDRWSGTIDSPGLALNPIDSNITGVDAGDLVSFAIVIENTGSSAKGAFDLTILDTLPAMYQIPAGGLNLRISNGDRSSSFSYTRPDGSVAVPSDIFSTGIEIVDPDPNNGACQAHTVGAGKNVIVITYDLEVRPDVTPGTQFNTATLVNYAGSDGGPNHVPSTPPTDTASSTVLASLTKQLVSTEINNANNSNTQAVIGELVTYRLTTTVPEGQVPTATVTDHLDSGLAFVSCTGVTPSSTDVTTDLASGSNFSGACADIAVSNNGQDVTFNLGNITNANRVNTTADTITIEYVAVVLNQSSNQGGTLLNNEAKFFTGATQLGATQNASTVNIIEPNVNITKAVAPTTGDAGDSFAYTITLSGATGADAFDITLNDDIDSLMENLVLTSVTDTASQVTAANFNFVPATGILTTVTPFNMPVNASRQIVLTFTGTVSYSATPGQVIPNNASVQWTSMNGVVTNRSPYYTNPADGNDDERTGSNSPAVNDYTKIGAAPFTVNQSASGKSFIITSETHTPETGDGSNITNQARPVTIGEIVRYRLISPIPEGTSPNFQVTDFLPTGLTFLDDGTARLALVYTDDNNILFGGVRSSSIDSVPAIPGGNACKIADLASLPVLPATLPCALADDNVSSSSLTTSVADTYGTGDDIYFRLGSLNNNDNDADTEYAVIDFNVLVDNTVTGSNDAGDIRTNFSQTFIGGSASGAFSNNVSVKIVEPGLAPTKTANPASGDAGDVITYTLVFQNTGVNASTAYEVSLTDTVPGKMTANLGSMTVVPSGASCSGLPSPTNTSSGNNVNITYATVPVGCIVTATYTATLNTNVTAGEVLANGVTLTYSSLPGTGTTPNPTGSTTPGGTGASNGERSYNNTAVGNVNVTNFGPVKSIFSTSAAHTTGADLAIGETLVYRLVTDLPEGTQTNLTIADVLPAGFTYVGNPLMSFIANTDVTENAGLSGADNDALPPTFAVPSYAGAGTVGVEVSGQTVTFHLGDVINNDSDSGAPNGTEQVVIDFTVVVNNDANTNNIDLKNNNYTVSTNNGSGVLTLRQTSNTVTARIVEPLPTIAKVANDLSWLYGQNVTFTLTVTNPNPPATPTAADSLATAFEIVVTDVVPASLTYVPGSITSAGNWVANDSAAPTLTWTCAQTNPTACSLPVNSTVALTYHATVDTPDILPVPTNGALTGSATATNTATMTWTSMPGVVAGERTGTTPVVQPNDYTRTSSQTGSLAYYSLGNRVWFDTNNSSAINFTPAASSESEQPAGTKIGVNGVTMKLYKDNGSGTYVDTGLTQTTANGGYYLFDNIEEGNYIVVIPATEFAAGKPLYGYWSSGVSISNAGVLSEAVAPLPNTDIDSDDNGTRQTSGPYAGGVASSPIVIAPVTLGTGNSEPTGETDTDGGSQGTLPDNRANMTVDFGFYRVGVGDIVWMDDVTVNGVYAAGETLVNGATISLYSADNATQLAVSLNGVWTGATGAGSIITGPSVDNPGWANGYYQFTGLPAGRYVVRVTGPTGTVSTVDSTDTTNPNTNNTNSNDNGIGITSNTVNSATGNTNALNLVPGAAGTVPNNNTITYTTGTSFNPTLDFGFANGYSIGNRVWYDTNNDSSINFTPESEQPVGTKIGVNGVTVQLYAADGAGAPTGAVLRTTTTANGGYYLFDSVLPGNYVVVLPASNFTGAGALVGYWSSATQRNVDGSNSETTAALANADVDSDDNGTRQTAGTFNNAVISSMITLGGTEPINEQNTDVNVLAAGAEHQGTQPDNRSNMTVDFGFYRVEVGNLIFTDVNRNGLYDAGDTVLSGVNVEILSSDGTSLGTTTSNASGLYQFGSLPQGTYIIRVTAPAGTFSTIDTGDTVAPNDNINPNDNFDSNDNGLDILGGDVDSAPVPLTPGAAQNFNTITYSNGTTTNPTMDFGFTGLTYSLGNRVWFDTNNSSAIDFTAESLNGATKIGVDGVLMKLYRDNGSGTYLDTGLTDTTANGGYYLFDGLSAGNYIVVIPDTEFVSGKPLYGYWSSATTIDNAGVVSETAAPDPDLGTGGGVDSDDSGTLQTSGAYLGGVAALPVTLGPTEPTGEHLTAGGHTADVDATETGANNQGFQPDDRANMTVDFGFYRLGVGDIVWIDDVLANGNYAVGETLFNGASVSLYAGNGTTQLAVSSNGVWQRTTGATSVSSGDAANGWANGYYAFTGLPAGNYVIKVVGPASSVSTTDSADTATPNNNVNNNDNGVGTAGNSVSSNQFALSAGTVGTAPNIITYTTGTSFNPSLDFGFLNTYSVGNRVWFDTNNNSAINFTAESEQPAGTKIGVDGVTVELYAAVAGVPTGAAIRTTTTAHGGYYLFDSVNAGDYVVVIPAANFDNTGVGDTTTALVGYWSSGTQRQNNGTITEAAAASADDSVDSDDNGTRQTTGAFNNAVISSMFTLGPIGNTEPTGEHLDSVGHTADVDVLATGAEHQGTQPDARSNMMIDFGFYRVEIGNLVFADVNRNGLFDGGDTVLQNVPLELFSAGGTSLGTTNSDINGLYQFSGQPSGSYYVRAVAPTGTVSTVDTGDTTPPNDTTSPDDNFDNNDNGVGILGGNTNSAVVTLTPGAAQNFNSVTYTNGTTTNPTIDFGFANSFSLGNRVWFDTNNDGSVAVGTEVGVPNVRVELYRDSGTSAGVFDAGDAFIAFDDTDATGYYRFDGLWPDNYIVVIPADNFRDVGAGDNVLTNPLAGYLSSGTEISAAGVISDTFSPAPDSPSSVDNDDNGASTFVSNVLSYVSAQAVTIGPGSTEPTLEAEPTPNPDTATGEAADNRSDRTVDFGFYRMQLSNQIFNDLNNDGLFTGADAPLAGAVVQLFASNGTTEIRVGPDGILGTADDAAGGVTTLAGGTYLFSGLPKGDYIVKVTPPSGYSATDVNADTTTPNNNVDNNDNGLLGNPGQVSSAVITLTPGVAGASTTVTNATATTLNPSMDFGFIPLYSLGNRIWFDTDNNSAINGAEDGISNVRVELYLDNGNGAYDAGDTFQSFTTTDASGFYRFDGLAPAGYVVLIPSSQFAAGGPLDRYWSSGTTIANNGTVTDSTTIAPDAGDVDNDDNGITTLLGNAVNYVSSKVVTLGPGLSEPTTDNSPATNPLAGEAPNDQSNRTVDFGFYRVELSNQIFWDVNSDGIFGAGDVVLPGATVKLYAADNSTEILVGPDGILGTADDAAGGVLNNAADGTYLFGGLPAGSYVVRVTPPAGFDSTIDNGTIPAGADSATPNNNLDNNDNGVGIGTGEVSSNAVPLTPGIASLNNVVTNGTGTTLNPSLDFGFVQNSVLEFSLGNRVWFDTNNNGAMDGAEVGIANVRVDLYIDNGTTAGVYDAGDTFVDFKTTDLTGYYRFDNLAAGNYVAVILPTQFASGGPLDGYWSSGTSIANNGTVTDSIGPDVDTNPADSDDNGVTTFAANIVNYVSSRAVTLGPTANEPVGETDKLPNPDAGEEPDNQSNRTVDFGFYQIQLGDQVFVDADNDGLFNNSDVALAGARVQLFAGNGTTEINVGPDGILGTIDDAANGMVTLANGLYLFSGLPAGNYIMKVTPPAGYLSTVDANADTATPNNNLNNNDNGVGVAAGQVSSNQVSLVAGVSGASTTVTNATAITRNPSMDFGFNVTNGFLKTVVGTSEPNTGGTDVTIGEIVTYQLTFDLTAGLALNNVVVTDNMDKGLAFVDCLSITIAGAPVACSPVVSPITNPGDAAGNPANPGRQVVFNIGNIPAPATATTMVIQYRAIVLDVIENQNGVKVNNNANVSWTGGSLTSSAPNVNVVEPNMAIDKSATPSSNVPLGTPIQFTLTINHTTPQSTADAFDVVVTDILPPDLEYVPCSITYSGWVPTSPAAPAYCPGTTNTLTFTWDTFPRGQVAVINFTARLIGTPATNVASIAWTSLDIDPGVGGLPQQLSVHNPKSTERWYDPTDNVNVYAVSDSVTINEPAASVGDGESTSLKLPTLLPATGFAPDVITSLPVQPTDKSYTATDVWLEIPSQGIKMPIVGVPMVDGDWDLSWLSQEAGWLNGTAFPGWDGNSALTGHVTLPNGKPGPFANLGRLNWGDKVIVHAYGEAYIYEVRENRIIKPYSTSILKHEDDAWLTLITCKTYIESTNTYADRTAVRAILIAVQKDATASNTNEKR